MIRYGVAVVTQHAAAPLIRLTSVLVQRVEKGIAASETHGAIGADERRCVETIGTTWRPGRAWSDKDITERWASRALDGGR